jgi:group I intron endonuclease
MKSTTFIYTLSDINGDIRYIGKSNTPRKRLYSHVKECKTSNKSHKINWIKSLLSKGESPIIEVLDEVVEEEWEFWEQYWIAQFRQWGFNLTNISIGGTNNNYKRTIETKQKMRKSKLGTKLPEEQKKKISHSLKIKYKEDPNYNKSSEKIHIINNEELYEKYIIENLSLNKCASFFKISKATVFRNLKEYGISKSKEVWEKQLSTNPKKVVLQYDLVGKLVKEWNCLVDISKELGFNKSNIANCCRGIGVSVSGYIWRYKDNFIEVDLGKLNYQKRKVKRYDLNGNFIKEYD